MERSLHGYLFCALCFNEKFQSVGAQGESNAAAFPFVSQVVVVKGVSPFKRKSFELLSQKKALFPLPVSLPPYVEPQQLHAQLTRICTCMQTDTRTAHRNMHMHADRHAQRHVCACM